MMTKSKITDEDLEHAIRQYVDQVELRDKLASDFDALMETLDWDRISGPVEDDAFDDAEDPNRGWWFRLRTESDYSRLAVPHLTHSVANHSVARGAAASGRNKAPAEVPVSLDWQQDGRSMRLQAEGLQVYLTITPAPVRDPSWMCWVSDPAAVESDVVEFELPFRESQGFLVQNLKVVPFGNRVAQIKALEKGDTAEVRRFLPFVLMD